MAARVSDAQLCGICLEQNDEISLHDDVPYFQKTAEDIRNIIKRQLHCTTPQNHYAHLECIRLSEVQHPKCNICERISKTLDFKEFAKQAATDYQMPEALVTRRKVRHYTASGEYKLKPKPREEDNK